MQDSIVAAAIGRLSLINVVSVITGTSSLYLLCLAIYRLYLCPIANFPGPTLAALSFWYEYYYDVHLGGQYMFKIKELHEQYGKPLPQPSVHQTLTKQAPSFESTRTSYMSSTQTSTMCSTPDPLRNVTSGGGQPACSETAIPSYSPDHMTSTGFVAVL